MSDITEQEIRRSLRAERRWAIFEEVVVAVVGAAVAAFMIGLVAAGTVVYLDAQSVPDRGVFDGE